MAGPGGDGVGDTPTSIGSRRSAGRRVDPWTPAVLVLACVTLAAAGILLWAFADPEGPAADVVPMPYLQQQRAADALSRAPTAQNLERARVASQWALREAPTQAQSWVNLAFIDVAINRKLTAAGLQDLQHSYDFEPLGPDISTWRLRFLFEHWDQLTPELRSAAAEELDAVGRRTQGREALESMQARIASPGGRLAAALLIARSRAKEAAKASAHVAAPRKVPR